MEEKINQTAQGYLLATPSKLFVPSGKLTPLMYNRSNGDYLKRISGPRGNFALIVDDVMAVSYTHLTLPTKRIV